MGQIHVTLEQASKSLIALLKAGADYIDGVVTYVHEVVGWLAIHAESAWELFVNDVNAVLLKVMSNAEAWAGQMGIAKQINEIDSKILVVVLLSFLVVVLILALWRKGKPKLSDQDQKTEITFEDVASQTSVNAEKERSDEFKTYQVEENYSQSEDDTIDVAYPKNTETAQKKSGFTFFRKSNKDPSTGSIGKDLEDDKFLLGIEQEMLATRQLFLDGVISKQVYVAETRSLYEKAQSRMT